MRKTPPSSFFFLQIVWRTMCFGIVLSPLASTWGQPADSTAAIRILAPAEIRGEDTPIATGDSTVLDPRTFAGSGMSLADVLGNLTGIQTRRTGGLGSHQTISIRGMGANQVVVCIDGVPISARHGAGVDLSGIDMAQFARIEVYKGYVPARFGGNGMGGAINLVTKPAVGHSGRVEASYGSHGTYGIALSASGAWTDSLHAGSTVSQRASDNDFEFVNRNGTPYNSEDDRTERRRNAQYSQFSGVHILRLAHRDGSASTLQIRHAQSDAGVPGQESSQTVTAGSEEKNVALRYVWESQEAPNQWRAEGFAHADRRRLHWYYPLDKIGIATDAAMESGAFESGAGARVGVDFAPNGATWTLGSAVELGSDRLESRNHSERFSASPWELGHSQGQWSANAQIRPWAWCAFDVEGLYRITRDHFSGGVVYSTMTEQRDRSDTWRNLYSTRLRSTVGPSQGPWRLFVAGGRFFRAPEAMEMYGTGPGLLPNPDLEPESGVQGEVGAEWQRGKLQWNGSAFINRSQGRIQWVTSGSLSKPFNLGRTGNQGVETALVYKPFRFADFEANATWQDPRDLSADATYRNNRTPDEPAQAYGAAVVLRLPWTIAVRLSGEARSELFRDRANRERIPAQKFGHVEVSASPLPRGRVRLAARNLGDAEYQDIYAATPTPGRQYFASYTQDF